MEGGINAPSTSINSSQSAHISKADTDLNFSLSLNYLHVKMVALYQDTVN